MKTSWKVSMTQCLSWDDGSQETNESWNICSFPMDLNMTRSTSLHSSLWVSMLIDALVGSTTQYQKQIRKIDVRIVIPSEDSHLISQVHNWRKKIWRQRTSWNWCTRNTRRSWYRCISVYLDVPRSRSDVRVIYKTLNPNLIWQRSLLNCGNQFESAIKIIMNDLARRRITRRPLTNMTARECLHVELMRLRWTKCMDPN